MTEDFYYFGDGLDFYRGPGALSDNWCGSADGELLSQQLEPGSYELNVSNVESGGQHEVAMRCGAFWQKGELACDSVTVNASTVDGADTIGGLAKEHHYEIIVVNGEVQQGWRTFDSCATGVDNQWTTLTVYTANMSTILHQGNPGDGCSGNAGVKLRIQLLPGTYWLVVEGHASSGNRNGVYEIRSACGPTWEQGAVDCDGTQTGNMADGGAPVLNAQQQDEHHYSFEVTQTRGVTISVDPGSGGSYGTACLKLYTGTDQVGCNTRGDAGTNCLKVQANYRSNDCVASVQARLQPGTYTVVVHGRTAFQSSNSYSLTVGCADFWKRGSLGCSININRYLNPNTDSANTVGQPPPEHHYEMEIAVAGKYEFDTCEQFSGSYISPMQLLVLQPGSSNIVTQASQGCTNGRRGTTLGNLTLERGTYTLAVESASTNPEQGGQYGLTMRCGARGPIACNQTVSGNTNDGVDSINSNTRREHHYTFAVPEANWITFDGCAGSTTNMILSIADVALSTVRASLRDRGYRGCMNGQRGSQLTAYLPQGTYTLVIEGQSAESNYAVTMRCGAFWERGAIGCDQNVTGSTTDGSDTLGDFSREQHWSFAVDEGQSGWRTFGTCGTGISGYNDHLYVYARGADVLNASTEVIAARENGGCFGGTGTTMSYNFPPGGYTVVVEADGNFGSGAFTLQATCNSDWEKGPVSDGSEMQGNTVDSSPDTFTNRGREHHYTLSVEATTGYSLDTLTVAQTTCIWIYTPEGVHIDDNSCTDFDTSCVFPVGASNCPQGLRGRLQAGQYIVVVQGNTNSGNGGDYDYQINIDNFWIKPEISCGDPVFDNTDVNSIGTVGNAAREHHYPFTVTAPGWVSFDSCGSTGITTTLHILSANTIFATANPASCPSGRNAAVVRTFLEVGDYTVVMEGASSSRGAYTMRMYCATDAADTTISCADLAPKTGLTDQGVHALPVSAGAQASREIIYAFVVTTEGWYSFDGCSGAGTLYIANRNTSTIVSSYRDPTGTRGCPAGSSGGRLNAFLSAGDYTLVIENAETSGSPYSVSMVCGSYWDTDEALTCGDTGTGNTGTGADLIGDFSLELHFGFTVPAGNFAWRTFDTCNTGVSSGVTHLYVYGADAQLEVATTAATTTRQDGGCGGQPGTRLSFLFPPGDYTLVAEGDGTASGLFSVREVCDAVWDKGDVTCDTNLAGDTTTDGADIFNVRGGSGLEHHYRLSVASTAGYVIDNVAADPTATCVWLVNANDGTEVGCNADGNATDSCVLPTGGSSCPTGMRARLHPGEYMIVVQGSATNGGSGGAYDVTVGCDDFWVQEELACGASVTGNTADGITTTGEQWPEHHYPVVIADAGWYMFASCRAPTADKWLYLHQTRPRRSVGLVASALPNTGCSVGTGTTIGPVWLEDGEYSLVVETRPDQAYVIEMFCAPAGTISCGATVTGSTAPGISMLELPARERHYTFDIASPTWVTFDGCGVGARGDTRLYVASANASSSAAISVSRHIPGYTAAAGPDVRPGLAWQAYQNPANGNDIQAIGTLPFSSPTPITSITFINQNPDGMPGGVAYGVLFIGYFKPPADASFEFKFRECQDSCAMWFGNAARDSASLSPAAATLRLAVSGQNDIGTASAMSGVALDSNTYYPLRIAWNNLRQTNPMLHFEWRQQGVADWEDALNTSFFYYGSGADYDRYATSIHPGALVGTGCGVGLGAKLDYQLEAGSYTLAVEATDADYSVAMTCGTDLWDRGNITCGETVTGDVADGVDRVSHAGREHHFSLAVALGAEYSIVLNNATDACIWLFDSSDVAVECSNCTYANDESQECITGMRVDLEQDTYQVIVEGGRDVPATNPYELDIFCSSIEELAASTGCGETITISGPATIPSAQLSQFSPVYELNVTISAGAASWYTVDSCASPTEVTHVEIFNRTADGGRGSLVVPPRRGGCGAGPGTSLSVLLETGTYKLLIRGTLAAGSEFTALVRCGAFWEQSTLECDGSVSGDPATGAGVMDLAVRELHYSIEVPVSNGPVGRSFSRPSGGGCIRLYNSVGSLINCSDASYQCVAVTDTDGCVSQIDAILTAGSFTFVVAEGSQAGSTTSSLGCTSFWVTGDLACGNGENTESGDTSTTGVSAMGQILSAAGVGSGLAAQYYPAPIRENHLTFTIATAGWYSFEVCEDSGNIALGETSLLVMDQPTSVVVTQQVDSGCPFGSSGAAIEHDFSLGDYTVVVGGSSSGPYTIRMYCGIQGGIGCNQTVSGNTANGVDAVQDLLFDGQACTDSDDCGSGLFCGFTVVGGVSSYFCRSCTNFCNSNSLDVNSLSCSNSCSGGATNQARENHYTLEVPTPEWYTFDTCSSVSRNTLTDANLYLYDSSLSTRTANTSQGTGCGGTASGTRLTTQLEPGSYTVVLEGAANGGWNYQLTSTCGTAWQQGELTCGQVVTAATFGSPSILDTAGQEHHYMLPVPSPSGYRLGLTAAAGETCMQIFDEEDNRVPECADEVTAGLSCYIPSIAGDPCVSVARARLNQGTFTIVVSSIWSSNGDYTLTMTCDNFWRHNYTLGQTVTGDTSTGFNVFGANPAREVHYAIEVPAAGSWYTFFACDTAGLGNTLDLRLFRGIGGRDFLGGSQLGICNGGVTVDLPAGSYTLVVEPRVDAQTVGVRYWLAMGGARGQDADDCNLMRDDCIAGRGACFFCAGATNTFLSSVSTTPSSGDVLQLSSSGIVTVVDGSFNQLGQLRAMNISHNRLPRVDQGQLDTLGGLRNLDMADNELIELHRQAFDRLGSLEELDLGGNPISCGWTPNTGLYCDGVCDWDGWVGTAQLVNLVRYICTFPSTTTAAPTQAAFTGTGTGLASTDTTGPATTVAPTTATAAATTTTAAVAVANTTAAAGDPSGDAAGSGESDDDGDKGGEMFDLIAMAIGGVIFLVIVGTAIWWFKLRKKKESKAHIPRNAALAERQREFQESEADKSHTERVWAEMDPEGGINQVNNPAFSAGLVQDGGAEDDATNKDFNFSDAVPEPDGGGNGYLAVDGLDSPPGGDPASDLHYGNAMPWMTEMTRQEATASLAGKPHGSFVVRPSTSASSGFCVTCIVEGSTKNYTIWKDPFGFSFPKADAKFPTVAALIDAAIAGPMKGFPLQLRAPEPPAPTIGLVMPGNYDAVETMHVPAGGFPPITAGESYTAVRNITEAPGTMEGFGDDEPVDAQVNNLAAEATEFLLGLGDAAAGGGGYLEVDTNEIEA